VPRLVAQLCGDRRRHLEATGDAPADRWTGRVPHENRDVLQAGLQTAAWVSVDDTGARHAGQNGFCTRIGNDDFAWFATRTSRAG
jgi:hypothetical protein